MGMNDRTYWWVSCDAEGCHAEMVDDGDEEYGAEEVARGCGFVKDDYGLWFCSAHAHLKG